MAVRTLLPKSFTFRTVGVSFVDEYPDNLHALRDAWDEMPFDAYGLPMESLTVLLVRAPDNPADPNAIEVHVPAIGQRIGYVGAALAARLAPALDSGLQVRCEVGAIFVHPEHEDRPGISVRVTQDGEIE